MADSLTPTLEHQTPRQYQTELFLEARKRNVIAYLDTGKTCPALDIIYRSGKTLVSVLLIKDKSGGLTENGQKRITVFLAPKVLLVQQQAEVLRKHTNLRVAHYCGDMNVDYWDRRRWAKELAEQDVWVMTPQILLNILRHGFIKITCVNLLVCDECHRAVKKDPYNCIMQEFYHDRATEGKRPHIFGMTASPVNTRAKQTQMKVSDAVWQLERNMDAQVITVINREPVTAAAPLPELKLVYYVRQHVSDALKEVEAGLASAIWTLHRGETVIAQLEAARAQQAAEAACIGLTLDEEKITSLSASTRRHLQGLALVVQVGLFTTSPGRPASV
ncbi:Dicer-like protein 1 [Trebouxia sp. C0009 RCD-2024]